MRKRGREGTTFRSSGSPCLAHWPLQIRQASSGRVVNKALVLWNHFSQKMFKNICRTTSYFFYSMPSRVLKQHSWCGKTSWVECSVVYSKALSWMVCILTYLPVGSINLLNYNTDTHYLKLCFLQLLNHLGLDTVPFCLCVFKVKIYQPMLWGFAF